MKNIRTIRNKPQYRTFHNDFIIKRITESSKLTTTLLKPTTNLQEVENVESDTHLKQFVIGNYQLINLPAVELSQLLSHLTKTETRRKLIDKEYSIWVGGLMTLNIKRNARSTRGRKSKKEKPIRQDATNK